MTGTISDTMKAAAIDRFGGTEEMKLQTLPVPEVGPDEVLIRVESVGVGAWDPWEREGLFQEIFRETHGVEPTFPYVIGFDGAGTVVALGEAVTRFAEGDRVYADRHMNPKGGFYAEYAVVNADHVHPIPGELTVEQAGAMPVDAITALLGLDDVLGLAEGESVLIFGAGGGLGHLAVQLAKRMGARVFAVASGEGGVALAERLGADAAVNGREHDVVAAAREFAPAGIDAVLLTAGGEAAEAALEALRDGGRVAYPRGVKPEPKARPGVVVTGYVGDHAGPAAFEKLNRLIESGPFEVHVARTFPLARAAEAHRALDEHYLGKLALVTQSSVQTPDADDRAEIVDALYRFGAGQDLHDRALFESAFSPDATLDFTGPARRLGVTIPVFEGRQAISDTIFSTIGSLDTTHTVTNPRVTFYDGDRATLFALVAAQHLPHGDHSRHLLLKNIYAVELSRQDAGWVIDHMRIDNVWHTGDPSVLFPAP